MKNCVRNSSSSLTSGIETGEAGPDTKGDRAACYSARSMWRAAPYRTLVNPAQ
jgi:hypothetical protein